MLEEACRFNEVMRLIAPQWKMQILFSIQWGDNRFSLLKKVYHSLSDQVLSKRLNELTKERFVNKVTAADPKHPGVTYYLTPKADELLTLVPRFCEWGEKWLGAGGQPKEAILTQQRYDA